MQLIETAIEIHAPAAQVWAILIDFSAYPAWSSFIIAAKGEPRCGMRLRITVSRPGCRQRERVRSRGPGVFVLIGTRIGTRRFSTARDGV